MIRREHTEIWHETKVGMAQFQKVAKTYRLRMPA